jgi:phenylacetate-CoA ligase
MRRWRELEASDGWSGDQLRDVQNRKLRRLLAVAGAHLPYYAGRFRQTGVDPSDPALTVEDLSALSPLTRADITEHREHMTWRGGKPIPQSTGGSSGEPLRLYIDRARQSADWAARWRARGWFGVRPGDPETILWGAPQHANFSERLRRLRDRLLNQQLLSAFDMSGGSMDAYLLHMNRFQPVCLHGYASSLALLARHSSGSAGAIQLCLSSARVRRRRERRGQSAGLGRRAE